MVRNSIFRLGQNPPSGTCGTCLLFEDQHLAVGTIYTYQVRMDECRSLHFLFWMLLVFSTLLGVFALSSCPLRLQPRIMKMGSTSALHLHQHQKTSVNILHHPSSFVHGQSDFQPETIHTHGPYQIRSFSETTLTKGAIRTYLSRSTQ